MMANPEMSSTQEQGLEAVPPQGRPAEGGQADGAVEAASGSAPAATVEAAPDSAAVAAAGAEPTEPAVPSPAARPTRGPVPVAELEPESRLPLMARVLLSDLAIAVIALVVLVVIEVQRLGDASLHLRRQAYAEDLVLLFGVTAVFGLITFFLIKAGHVRVAIVQAVVTALVLALAITSAASGNPKPTPVNPDDPSVSSTQ